MSLVFLQIESQAPYFVLFLCWLQDDLPSSETFLYQMVETGGDHLEEVKNMLLLVDTSSVLDKFECLMRSS